MSKISQQARETISKKLTGIKRSDKTKKKNNKLKIIIPISLFLSIMIILVILFIIYRKRRFIEIKK